ncbi:MAG: hypothetical protein KDE56_32005, partial [Anaerolineales bacterium]|nr:hypothetical protein [Anaerolineales bacterium]
VRGLVRGRLRLFSAQQPVDDGAFVRDGHIWLRDGERETAVCPLNHIQLRGGHNILNVLAATTLADAAGIPVAAMAEAIHTFHGVAHRLELVRLLNGVHYINDSIATAPERALAALNAFTEPIVLLAGGRDKDMQWETWAQVVPQRTKQVILFGQLGEMLEGLLDCPVVRVNTLAEAVGVAAETAVSGDIVLLSPGGTSYDAYNDFVERGEHFRALVQALLP